MDVNQDNSIAMTPEQLQAIAEREYPYENGSFVSDPYENSIIEKKRDAFIHGLTYSKWVKVEDGCEMPREHKRIGWRTEAVALTVDGETVPGYYSHLAKAWFNGPNNIVSPTAWQPLPEPYKK